MKKILLIVCSLIVLGGCSHENDNYIEKFKNNVEKTKSYSIEGKMQISNDEEIYNYDITVDYLKENYYKVEMKNLSNEHVQIILKNDDGLYVITPKLNKSFKFDSNWPNNSSQAYILKSLIEDIDNDKNVKLEKEKDINVIKSSVNYPNNKDLSYEKIYLNDDNMVTKVVVYSEADIPKITIEFKNVDMKAGLKKDLFKLDNYIKKDQKECTENCDDEAISQIETAIYPLYMPSNTYLSASDVVKNDEDSRIILSYSGDRNFVIIEETANATLEHEIIPVYGDPVMLNDTIAALSTNSIYWTSNDIEYYLVSENLSSDEMVFVASSLGNYSATIATK